MYLSQFYTVAGMIAAGVALCPTPSRRQQKKYWTAIQGLYHGVEVGKTEYLWVRRSLLTVIIHYRMWLIKVFSKRCGKKQS